MSKGKAVSRAGPKPCTGPAVPEKTGSTSTHFEPTRSSIEACPSQLTAKGRCAIACRSSGSVGGTSVRDRSRVICTQARRRK